MPSLGLFVFRKAWQAAAFRHSSHIRRPGSLQRQAARQSQAGGACQGMPGSVRRPRNASRHRGRAPQRSAQPAGHRLHRPGQAAGAARAGATKVRNRRIQFPRTLLAVWKGRRGSRRAISTALSYPGGRFSYRGGAEAGFPSYPGGGVQIIVQNTSKDTATKVRNMQRNKFPKKFTLTAIGIPSSFDSIEARKTCRCHRKTTWP